MPRANRTFVPNQVWHLTHRCHKKEFLLKFARDRRRWVSLLYQATRRFGLCVLNYTVTSNHIHLLVLARGGEDIPRSLQWIAGRTAQEYNQRKGRRGAFWEDRYHATAVDTEEYLARCLAYIDLNMVRARVVSHPAEWPEGGYREIQFPRRRYQIVDLDTLMRLLGFGDRPGLQHAHREWVEERLRSGWTARDARWSESVAVGSESFVDGVRKQLGLERRHRVIPWGKSGHVLREPAIAYGRAFGAEMAALSP
jgi:REP-associated tyrosine transposase